MEKIENLNSEQVIKIKNCIEILEFFSSSEVRYTDVEIKGLLSSFLNSSVEEVEDIIKNNQPETYNNSIKIVKKLYKDKFNIINQ